MLKQPALNSFQGDEVGEVCDPPFDLLEVSKDGFDHPRLWRTWDTGEWRTDYPPPSDFEGHEEGDWGLGGYCRALSENELAALVAAGIAEPWETAQEVSMEEDEAERRAFFDSLADHSDSSAVWNRSGDGTI